MRWIRAHCRLSRDRATRNCGAIPAALRSRALLRHCEGGSQTIGAIHRDCHHRPKAMREPPRDWEPRLWRPVRQQNHSIEHLDVILLQNHVTLS
jgi:hypothetical protein